MEQKEEEFGGEGNRQNIQHSIKYLLNIQRDLGE